MSETTEAPETITPPPVEEAPAAPVEAVEATAAPETPEQAEAASETAAEGELDVEKLKKSQERLQKRIATMTRKANDETRLREAAERELQAHRDLLKQMKGDAPEEAPSKPQITEADIEREISRREFGKRLGAIDSAGRDAFGADAWNEAKNTMTALGAVVNDDFLKALAETDNAHRIFAQLADDPDELQGLMAKSPAGMAAYLGRMDARMSTPKPAPRPTSNAPRPPSPVSGSAVPAPMTLDAAAKSDDISDFEAALKRELGKSKLFGF